ncbi:MAG: PqqD family protein [Bacteroidaceae bacterium]|nr:PqqD family protein [Bacteroidaceae bacterium]
MEIKKGFEVRTICGENIIIAHGKENINFTKVITLNESALDIWNAMSGKTFTLDDAVKVLTDNYEVDEATARQDAESLLKEWINVGICE